MAPGLQRSLPATDHIHHLSLTRGHYGNCPSTLSCAHKSPCDSLIQSTLAGVNKYMPACVDVCSHDLHFFVFVFFSFLLRLTAEAGMSAADRWLASWDTRVFCLPCMFYCSLFVLRVSKFAAVRIIMLTAIIKIVNKEASFVFCRFHTTGSATEDTDCPAKSVWMTRMKPTQCECCLCCFVKCWFVRGGVTDTDSFTACFIDHIVVSQDICCYDL